MTDIDYPELYLVETVDLDHPDGPFWPTLICSSRAAAQAVANLMGAKVVAIPFMGTVPPDPKPVDWARALDMVVSPELAHHLLEGNDAFVGAYLQALVDEQLKRHGVAPGSVLSLAEWRKAEEAEA